MKDLGLIYIYPRRYSRNSLTANSYGVNQNPRGTEMESLWHRRINLHLVCLVFVGAVPCGIEHIVSTLFLLRCFITFLCTCFNTYFSGHGPPFFFQVPEMKLCTGRTGALRGNGTVIHQGISGCSLEC